MDRRMDIYLLFYYVLITCYRGVGPGRGLDLGGWREMKE